MKLMSAKNFTVLFFICLVLAGCSREQEYPFSFVEQKSGISVYLDGQKGKIIYIDETNRIIDYVDLRPNSTAIQVIEQNKNDALVNKDRGSKDMPGTDYSIELSTRFYNNRLLYMIKLSPFNDKIKRFARTVSIQLMDDRGFVLGEIESSYDWTTSVDVTGKEIALDAQGSIPITLRNYLEIVNWGPLWQTID
jgi:hypothetical protein